MTEPWTPVVESAATRANEIEHQRRLPDDLVAALAATGVLRLWLPSAYGGGETTLQAGLDAIEEASYHDGSTGWAVMIANTTALLAASLAEADAQELFGAPDAIGGGFAAPVGTARVTPDGIVVHGQWDWGSGSTHCTTIGGGVRVLDHTGASASLPGGGRTAFAFFDLDDVAFHDTWHVSGLKGTASNHYEVDGTLVSPGRVVSLDVRHLVVDTPLYRFSTFGALALGVASVMAGLARRAIDELIECATKVPQGSSRTLAERSVVQMDLAQADAGLRAGKAFVREVVDEAWSEATAMKPITEDHKCALRLAANHLSEMAARTVDLCYHAAGGTAIYDHNPLQRVFRDAHVATQHAMVAPRVYEPLGRRGFGLETDTRSL